jgi:hypothetical protein
LKSAVQIAFFKKTQKSFFENDFFVSSDVTAEDRLVRVLLFLRNNGQHRPPTAGSGQPPRGLLSLVRG